ncbi:toll-like receptor 6 [Mytilus galloprovincialis]|uniref:toll-like receptor 6 n=1 Tax=Mytilus galloprovincialis TaxID=29158 RepID=UPI003F7BC06C
MILLWCSSLLLLSNVIAVNFTTCYSENQKIICSCDHHQMICSDHGEKLDFIPKVSNNIKMLIFTNNNLNQVTETTFRNMTRSMTSHLSLAGNDIRYISKHTFREFTSLTFLDLSYNVIPVNVEIAFSNLHFIANGSLILNHMNISETKINELFRYLDTNGIETLSLAYNNLEDIDSCDWRNFQSLKTLNITGNKLKNMTFKCHTKIEILHADSNNLVSFPNFCLDNINVTTYKLTSVPSLRVFSAINNIIEEMPSTALRCTDDLRELFITKNSFHEIDLQTFYKLNTLKMSSIFRYYQSIKPHSHSKLLTASIEHLMLQNLSFGMFPTDLRMFEGLHHLKSLDLSYSNLPFSPIASKIVFKSLSNLTKLTLQFVRWKSMPHNIFHLLPNLKTLDLSNNEITYLSWSRFRYLKYLEEVDFSNNRIFLSGRLSVPSSILSLISLDISNNTYYCSCEVLSFFEELSSNNVTIKYYPEAYSCTSPRSMADKSVADVECMQHLETIVYTIIITVLFGCVFAIMAYKSRYRIRYLIHISRSRHSWKVRKKSPQPLLFDGFVIYSEPDKDWVYDNFLPFLEKQHGYKLCIHDRDFQYGRLIVDNIVENMKNSRKIVLILSESFAESKWCQFEVLLAHERFLEHGPDSLISIKLEEITTFRMTNTLETLIKFATHAVWSNQNKEEFSVRILDCFQVKTDNIYGNNSNTSKHRCSHSHAQKMKVKEDRNKIFSDKFEHMFNEMCSRVDLMSETLCRRMDSLEKTVKSDITFLKNKVDKLETNLTSLQDSIIYSQSTSK